ncbi:MAG: hypothetical protein GX596_14000, partial [Propionibacterium sp.]|nr:hypothetical protein [Propionibacterium sp.]
MSEQSAVGFVAITGELASIRQALARIGHPPGATVHGVHLATWGLGGDIPRERAPLLLTTTNRSGGARVAPAVIGRWLAEGDLPRLRGMLPPFAALGVTDDALRLSTDGFGFRPVFRAAADGWAAVSTSALLLARLLDSGLDEAGVLLQSQLGWQLERRTL